jgi:hypothetical protein
VYPGVAGNLPTFYRRRIWDNDLAGLARGGDVRIEDVALRFALARRAGRRYRSADPLSRLNRDELLRLRRRYRHGAPASAFRAVSSAAREYESGRNAAEPSGVLLAARRGLRGRAEAAPVVEHRRWAGALSSDREASRDSARAMMRRRFAEGEDGE